MSKDPLLFAALRAMILVALADHDGRDHEIDAMSDRWRALSGSAPARELMMSEMRAAASEPEGTWRQIAEAQLSDDDKEQVVKSVIIACVADAELQDAELAILNRVASTLGVHATRVRGLMSEVFRETRDRHRA